MKEKHIFPFLDKRIENYCQTHTSQEADNLRELTRTTHLNFIHPNMISGNWQGRLLSILSKMISPKRILEIGTFTGYSTLCLSEGLAKDGIIHTIEIDYELEPFLKDLFEKNNIKDRVQLHIGNGLDIIRDLKEEFDLIFIDADKANYPIYYDLCIDKLRKGGVILADNTLWYGRIALHPMPQDKDTIGIDSFNKKITLDNRVENLIIPIRDGIMIGRKI